MKLLERLWPGPGLAPTVLGAAEEPAEAAPDPASSRYDGNPQLAVIESYALDVIGELPPEDVEDLDDAVTELFGEAPDWRDAVRRGLGWNPLVDMAIAEGWHRFRQAARAEGRDPEPAAFARFFADELVRLSRS
jgi:hypothetical protein